jgi:hypothetical protein
MLRFDASPCLRRGQKCQGDPDHCDLSATRETGESVASAVGVPGVHASCKI